MRLIDQFERPEPTPEDAYTFVFDTQQEGLHDMLVMGQDGYRSGYWTRGPYDPTGENDHLGRRVDLRDLGAAALDAFFYRLSIPEGWEEIFDAATAIADEIDAEIAGEEDDEEEDDAFDLTDALRRLNQFRIQQRDAERKDGDE